MILRREQVLDELMPGLNPTREREGEESGVAHEGGRRCADVVGEVLILGIQHIIDGQGEDLQAGKEAGREAQG